MIPFITDQIEETIEIKKNLLSHSFLSNLKDVCDVCVESIRNGGRVLIAGNGGSAADAQHIAGELVSRFYFDRPALPAMALTTDTSILTAIGNDYGYEDVFSRQIEGNGKEQDVFIGISTSGNSPNILKAIRTSQSMKIVTVGMTGESGGLMGNECDYCIKVPSQETPRIQESHILVGHILCSIIERSFFGEKF